MLRRVDFSMSSALRALVCSGVFSVLSGLMLFGLMLCGCDDSGRGVNICGDGVKGGIEECDDGNPASGDGCSTDCKVEAGCTDGEKRCSGTRIQTCSNGIWGKAERCAEENQECNSSSGSCEAVTACEDGATSCDDEQVRFCEKGVWGEAEDCNKGEVCKGDTQKGACEENGEEEVCDPGLLVCGGRCIDPDRDSQYCGAKGNCTGSSAGGVDYAGVSCEGGTVCLEGQCRCPSGFVLCDGNCIDPQLDNNFCGAKGACNMPIDSHADYMGSKCAEHSACVEGSCKVVSCEEGLRLCPSADGGNSCINVMGDDPNNCGSCGWKCKDHPMNGATSDTCLKGMCQYKCPSDTVNCAPDDLKNTEPLCLSEADRKDDPKHCGGGKQGCGVDCNDKNPICLESECKPWTCPNNPDACYKHGCGQHISGCGKSCVGCRMLPNIYTNENAEAAVKCIDNEASAERGTEAAAEGDTVGSCKISRCADGYHLNRKTSGNACVRNRVDKCAPPNQAEDGDNTDCRKIAGVALSACSPKGICNALRCETNYHLVRDAERDVFNCVPNTDSACGAVDSVAVKNCENFSADKPLHCRMGVCVYDQADGKWGEHELSQNIWCNSYYGAPTPCPYVEGKLRYCTREAGNTFGCGYLCVQGSNAEGAHNAVSCEGKCILFGDGASCDLCKNCNDGERCYKDAESGKVLCAACEDVCSAPQICTEDKTARFACTHCDKKCPAQQCYLNDNGNFDCTECELGCPVTQNCYQKDDGNFACTNCVPPCAEGERCYLNEQGKFACTECKESCTAPEHCYFIKDKAASFVCR